MTKNDTTDDGNPNVNRGPGSRRDPNAKRGPSSRRGSVAKPGAAAGDEAVFRVRTAQELRVLHSAGRMAVIEAMLEGGPTTAAQIAARAGCRPQAAHYHLKKLIGIGLAREAGHRETGGRPETLFELTARRILLEPTRMTPAFRHELLHGARVFLRRAERDLAAAIQDDAAGHRAANRLRITRDIVRLSDDDLELLTTKLREIESLLRSRDDPAKPHRIGITITIAPVDR